MLFNDPWDFNQVHNWSSKGFEFDTPDIGVLYQRLELFFWHRWQLRAWCKHCALYCWQLLSSCCQVSQCSFMVWATCWAPLFMLLPTTSSLPVFYEENTELRHYLCTVFGSFSLPGNKESGWWVLRMISHDKCALLYFSNQLLYCEYYYILFFHFCTTVVMQCFHWTAVLYVLIDAILMTAKH